MSILPIMPPHVQGELPFAPGTDPAGLWWIKIPIGLRKPKPDEGDEGTSRPQESPRTRNSLLALLGVLWEKANAYNDVYATNAELAKLLGNGCPKHTARKLALMESEGWISRFGSGSSRRIRINEGFHERNHRAKDAATDPRASAGVDKRTTPAQARGGGRASAGVDKRTTPAQAQPSIRVLNPEQKDSLREGRSSSAGSGQEPPPPTARDGEGAESKSLAEFLDCDEALPSPGDVDPRLAPFLPRVIPATTSVGPLGKLKTTSERVEFPTPISAADRLTPEVLDDLDRQRRELPVGSAERQAITIAMLRHKQAWKRATLPGFGPIQPGGVNAVDAIRPAPETIPPACPALVPEPSPDLAAAARFLPDVPVGATITVGPRRLPVPGLKTQPLPITPATILDGADVATIKQLFARAPEGSAEERLLLTAYSRHLRAVERFGISPQPIELKAERVIDVTSLTAELGLPGAQESGPTHTLRS